MNNISKRIIILLMLFFTALGTSFAQPFLRLPSIIGDHMVLQENSKVRIWGWADPNTTVTVNSSWGESVTVKTDFATRWEAEILTPPSSSESRSITVTTGRKVSVTIEDVLIGQVWLCGGQSNMNYSAANNVVDMREELKSNMNSEIRLFTVTKKASPYPQDDCVGHWEVCDKESAYYFSAVGYFFGKRLASELDCPVGLVNSSWGGTPIEVWMPSNLVREDEELMAAWKGLSYSRRTGWDVACAYNAMIVPLLKMVFAGVIWYQGESNKGNCRLYGREFKMMIESWRTAFSRELPFYFVQIAPHSRKDDGITGAIVREQQAWVGANVRGTGMVVISDKVDDVTNIHPRYKKTVGDRLANWALSTVYGRADIKCRHPEMSYVDFTKGQAIVTFKYADGGLVCRGSKIQGLEIADASMKFVPAQGMLRQDGKLVVWSKAIKRPVAVRYCFRDAGIGNLFDVTGLPLAPFRSDSDNFAELATIPDEEVSKIAVTAYGSGFELRKFEKGTEFFLNRNYKISSLPERFSGFMMLSHAAEKDQTQKCRVKAKSDGRIYIVLRSNSRNAGCIDGWIMERNSEIIYPTRGNPGILYIYRKDVKAGETIKLPETVDFAGISLLAADIEYIVK